MTVLTKPSILVRSALALALVASSSRAQNQTQFQWKFANNVVSTTLTQCQTYGLIAENRTSNASELGVPPYYVIAFPAAGIPTTTLVGTDPNNLAYQVNLPVGSNVLLTMTDSQGNPGGTAAQLYQVAAGSSASCVLPSPSENVTLVSNLSDTLTTCQPWGLRVYGGHMPFTISLAAVNSPVVTNVTMGSTDDVFTYIDRADPNGQMLAAVSDATGTWGSTTAFLQTQGDVNTSCVGLVSSSGNSSTVDQHPAPPSKSHTGMIVGVVIGVIALLGLVALLALYMWRRNKLAKEREAEPAFIPEAWTAPMSTVGGEGSSMAGASNVPSAKMARFMAESQAAQSHEGTSLLSYPLSPLQGGSSRPSSSTSNPDFAYPSGMSRTSSTAKGLHRSNLSGGSSGVGPGALPEGWGAEPHLVIQHRDAGIVQEVPPPYMDRTLLQPQNTSSGGESNASHDQNTVTSGSSARGRAS